MTEKIKTGLCVLALLLSLWMAYAQEMSYRNAQANGDPVQPAPFGVTQIQ